MVDGCDTEYGLRSLAVQGDVLIAGEPYATNGGRMFVYRRNAGVWTLEGILTRPGTVFNDLVGFHVAAGGSRVFASARHVNANGVVDVFRYNAAAPDPPQPPSCSFIDPGKWRLTAELASPPDPYDYWGAMDSNLDGTRLLVGDHRDGGHLFELSGGVWTQIALLTPYPTELAGDYAALGGPEGDTVAVLGENAGYIYAELEGGWTQIDQVAARSPVAAAADSVFFGSAEVYRLDPVCLQE